ncbi:MAG TPA: TldD/PmbA family protein [Chloroflexota bacterium]|nr:TldD/PmbA family protein [Chloroflexota bacterium]
MEELGLAVLDEATRLGAAYADVRVMRRRSDTVQTRDGELEHAGEERDDGLGVRVLVDGAWGFAAQTGLDRAAGDRAARSAVVAARATARVNRRAVELAPNPPAVAAYRTPLHRDPFAVPLEEKQALLLAAERTLRAHHSVQVSSAHLVAFRTEKFFCSSDGARIEQDVIECGGGLFALALGEEKPARRSFDNYGQAGWEFVERLNLEQQGARVGEEAAGLLTAPYVEPGPTDVVLGSDQLALMVHETCGHPTELDRVLGFEDAFAGGSFLQPADLGTLRYGSEHVNLIADSTLAEGLGTFAYDDDGVPAQHFSLVRHGIFCGYLSSRETASMIGWDHSTGCSRADGWGRIPIVRMVNVSLEAGEVPLEDLIGDVKDGLYLDTPSSWSLDDKRLNFHFGMEYGREIKNGKLGGLCRGATIQSITPQFWGRCDGVAEPAEWYLWGFLSCAKGEPLQSLHVGHGAAPARFRGVTVGVER